MSVISAIAPAPQHPGRFHILVDGALVATLAIDAIERLQLAVGRSVAGLHDRIATENAHLKVYDRAVNMLAVRARSSSDLAAALRKKGEDAAHVEQVIQRLQQHGLLNDATFAQSFVRAKVLGASQSRRRVQQGLAKKGVAREVSDAAIAMVLQDEAVDQVALAELAARKKMRTLAALDPIVRKRRLYAFLARRGFDADHIRRAMHAVGEELRG